jgi:excinuclease ABC subunit A
VSEKGHILVEGARTHNLRGVSCAIPHGKLTVVTGVSGSGKSSLAFDTLYAEGQRRFVESLSTYARQFLERMPRPDVDRLTGIPPSIAIEQRNGVKNARSTVGTVTEIADYLRLLYARVGVVHCPGCGGEVARDTASAAAERVLAVAAGERVHVVGRGPAGGDAARRLDELVKAGWRRLFLDEKVVDAAALDAGEVRALRALPVLVDRLRVSADERSRLAEALQAAFAVGQGRAEVWREGAAEPLRFDEGYVCASCGRGLKPPAPALFSFNSPLGACEACQGFGRVIGIDLDKVIPDGRKSLAGGAVALFQMPSAMECQEDLVRLAKKRKTARLDVPWHALDEAERRWVIDGDPGYQEGGWRKGQWYGVRGFFRYLESKKYKMHVRVLLARFRGYDPCGACGGTRLRDEARAVRVDGRTIAELDQTPVDALRGWARGLGARLGRQARATAAPLVEEIESRLAYLDEVGLGYLTLGRQARTLSGGEAQRIALASALGARLTATLYVLDEPSIGLHPRDTARLLSVIGKLTARGNTVVVVEHDPEIMRAADHVIDLGPGAGRRGGEVVFAGSYVALASSADSRTGDFLRRRSRVRPPRRGPTEACVRVVGAREHNLAGIDASFPIGRFTVVTGVSGSGKSTLVVEVLHGQAMRARGEPVDGAGVCDALLGLEAFAEVALVDQSPPARSTRSNPATYLKAMDELRQRFAATPAAEHLALGAGAFSFNVAGGRCEACQGQGTVTLEMHFLADVTVVCDGCGGKRFSEKVLGVRWRGLSILDCLELTVEEALARFADDQKLVHRLRPFAEVGLGYLTLGQSTATLSGGESQRLKLAAHLYARRGATLFLLDEPTTGLHGTDVEVLLAAIDRLIDAGHTVIAIEHNLDVIAHADHLIDLGPEGGAGGGRVVGQGPPETVARLDTHTGRALRALLKIRNGGQAAGSQAVDAPQRF